MCVMSPWGKGGGGGGGGGENAGPGFIRGSGLPISLTRYGSYHQILRELKRA